MATATLDYPRNYGMEALRQDGWVDIYSAECPCCGERKAARYVENELLGLDGRILSETKTFRFVGPIKLRKGSLTKMEFDCLTCGKQWKVKKFLSFR